MTDWTAAQRKAASTARWAVTMTKVRIRRTIARTRWQLVTFVGAAKGESVGIVDMLAIRKNHRPAADGLKRGDMFEVVLVQVKGGASALPSLDEIGRLRAVAKAYKAKAVLLAHWRKGRQASFFKMKRLSKKCGAPADCWSLLETPDVVFH